MDPRILKIGHLYRGRSLYQRHLTATSSWFSYQLLTSFTRVRLTMIGMVLIDCSVLKTTMDRALLAPIQMSQHTFQTVPDPHWDVKHSTKSTILSRLQKKIVFSQGAWQIFRSLAY